MPDQNLLALMNRKLPKGALALLHRIGEAADRAGMSAYAVGGFVRDLMLGRDIFDLDVVVEGDTEKLGRALARRLGAKAVFHQRFGTGTLEIPEKTAKKEFAGIGRVDLVRARKETYRRTGALPDVEPGTIRDDLFRRDFTINTMAIRLDAAGFGGLVDFFDGCRDLREGKIRVLHDLSFRDDPTRIFRAARFEQRFDFEIETRTAKLIRDAVRRNVLNRISRERLRHEMVLLLSEKEPEKAMRRLDGLGVLVFIHPRLRVTEKSRRLFRAIRSVLSGGKRGIPGGKADPWLTYLPALLNGLDADGAAAAAERLALGRGERKAVSAAKGARAALRIIDRADIAPSRIHRLLDPLPVETLVLLLAGARTPAGRKRITEFQRRRDTARPALNGEDLKKMGIPPGPVYREILYALRDARLDGKVKNRQEEIALAKRIAGKTKSTGPANAA